jgi:DNA repair protein RecN (Recombination protein N)
MLRYLKVSNLAIIDRVEVEFHHGFNVLTGETGAGKSILVGALQLLLGARSSQEIIRTGEDEATVEGLFEIVGGRTPPEEVQEIIGDAGELILSRKLSRAGRSRCAINGNMATLAMLQSVGQWLVSIFGQHEHQALLDSEEHVEILDRYGDLAVVRQETAEAFSAWARTKRELARADERREALERLAAENTAAVEELTDAGLQPGEEEQLVEEREILKKAVQIRERAFEAHQALYSRSGSLIGGLTDVKKAIDYLASANPRLSKLSENFEEALYRIEDVALELRSVSESSQSDPLRLEQIEERLGLLRRLKKKYAKDIPGLLTHLESLSEEAGEILEARSETRNLAAKEAQDKDRYFGAASKLSAERRRAAAQLEKAMKKELKALAMPEAVFSVSFTEVEETKASSQGMEKVEFFLASNPGETARPLARIASGGELSRIMLAIKALQVDTQGASTVIFDEVDAGIGGHTASAVSTRLARVAERQQVLCVTHLHQIAARADHHLFVRKNVRDGRTHIEVSPLQQEARVDELARMLGAAPDAESVRDHVRQLIDQSSAEVSG